MALIIQRTLISFGIGAMLFVIARYYSSVMAGLIRKQTAGHLPFHSEGEKATLLYFWSAQCTQCKPQERQIDAAQKALLQEGKILEVKKINALEEQDVSRRFHIMTVPTLVLLDSHGTVTAFNPGFTRAQKIVNQYSIPVEHALKNI